MARTNTGPRYFKSKGGYYATVGKKRYLLAKGPKADPAVRKAAERQYHRLKADAEVAETEYDDKPCYFLFEAYVRWFQENRAESTFKHRLHHVTRFTERHGKVRAKDLTRRHLHDHLNAEAGWSSSTKYAAAASVLAGLNWAVQQGRLTRNPIVGFKRPRQESRVKNPNAFITDDTHAVLLANSRTWVRPYLEMLDLTGARPGELMAVRAEHWRPDIGAFQPPGGKGEYQEREHRTRRRTVYVADVARPLVERLVAERPEGPLFRNSVGRPLTKQYFCNWLKGLKDRGLVPKATCPVLYRHRFITKALLAGVPVAKVAAVAGNSVGVIERNYNHLDLYGGELKAVVDKLAGQPGMSPGGG